MERLFENQSLKLKPNFSVARLVTCHFAYETFRLLDNVHTAQFAY